MKNSRIQLLESQRLRPRYKQPIHHWVQKFVDNQTRYVIFLYQESDRDQDSLGTQTNFIMNANQLYKTKHRKPRIFKIRDEDFEHVGSEWKKVHKTSQ